MYLLTVGILPLGDTVAKRGPSYGIEHGPAIGGGSGRNATVLAPESLGALPVNGRGTFVKILSRDQQ